MTRIIVKLVDPLQYFTNSMKFRTYIPRISLRCTSISPMRAKARTKKSAIASLWSIDFPAISRITQSDSRPMNSFKTFPNSSVDFTSLPNVDSKIRIVSSLNLQKTEIQKHFEEQSISVTRSLIPQVEIKEVYWQIRKTTYDFEFESKRGKFVPKLPWTFSPLFSFQILTRETVTLLAMWF